MTYLTSGDKEGTEHPRKPTVAIVPDDKQAKELKENQLADSDEEEWYRWLEVTLKHTRNYRCDLKGSSSIRIFAHLISN